MSKTATALLVKLLMTFAFSVLAFSFLDRNNLGWSFLVAVLVTGVNYLVGDLMILPSWGNTVASVGDGVMAALTAWIVSMVSPNVDTGLASLLAFGALTAVGEYFFHQYLLSSEQVAP